MATLVTKQLLIVHVYTKFQHSSLKIPEKTPTQIFNVSLYFEERKKEKWMKNRKIRAMTLSLDPTIQSLFYTCKPYLKILACTVPEKTATQIKP